MRSTTRLTQPVVMNEDTFIEKKDVVAGEFGISYDTYSKPLNVFA